MSLKNDHNIDTQQPQMTWLHGLWLFCVLYLEAVGNLLHVYAQGILLGIEKVPTVVWQSGSFKPSQYLTLLQTSTDTVQFNSNFGFLWAPLNNLQTSLV